MIGGLGIPELVVILVLALLIFGPTRLPEVGKQIGKGLKEFRKSVQTLGDDVQALGDEIKADIPDITDDIVDKAETVITPIEVNEREEVKSGKSAT